MRARGDDLSRSREEREALKKAIHDIVGLDVASMILIGVLVVAAIGFESAAGVLAVGLLAVILGTFLKPIGHAAKLHADIAANSHPKS